jgi:hypothetical protein
VEVSLIGREGLVGLPAVLGTISSPFRSFMHIAGNGFRVKTRVVSRHPRTPRPARVSR